MQKIDLKNATFVISGAKCKECKWSGEPSQLQYNDATYLRDVYDLCPKCGSSNTEVFVAKEVNYEEYRRLQLNT